MLAMLCLEAATLSKMNNCYDYYHGWLIEDLINDKLTKVKE